MSEQREGRKGMPNIDKDIQKEAVKEALTEWLEAKYATFGKWSMRSIGAAALVVLAYLFLSSHGWKP